MYTSNRTKLGLATLLGVVCCLLATVFSTACAQGQSVVYQVGVSKVDVTPDYPIRLNGFGFRREESEGVNQRIWVKALAISQEDEQPVILLTLDSLGIRLPMLDEVAARLKQKTGLPRERIVLSFSHSHTTPKVNGASDNIFSQAIPAAHQKHIDRYTGELAEAIERAALAAIESRKPSRLSWSVGKVTFAKNRRTAGGPVDHDLPMLAVKALDGKVRAIYVSYACHCVTLSDNKISGDWAGYAQEMIERRFPGSVALVAIGAGSDQNPQSGVQGGKTEIAAAQGDQIAHEVARLLKGPLKALSAQPAATLQRIDLPLNPLPTREQFEQMAAKGGPAGYNASTKLARLDRGEKLLTKIDYPIQTLSFGDELAMVFLAGEVCVDYSLRLKRELNRERIWINAYSNDFCSYIPSERLAKEGGYGGGSEIPYFALPTTLEAGLEQLIIDEVRKQVPASYRVKPGTQGVPPQSPEDSLRSMKTHDDLQIELVAAEPLIADPVAIDFGPDGRLWVTEMSDYTRATDEEFQPNGRIRVVSDSNGDGKFDKSTVFLGGLRFPTDVKLWRNGVLVCDAPDILYAEDTTGDGRADVRKVLFSGFETKNPHARVNSLRLGLDNWIYGSGGLFGGQITSFSGKTANCTGRDFRLNPDTGDIEAVTGRTQQGRIRSDWGDWFGCTNGSLFLHYPLVDRYVRRNPHLAPPASVVSVPADANAATLFPIGELVRFKLSGPAGRPTSVCGAAIYRDELLGQAFAGNGFSCEPVNQLVHRLVLSRRGGTFAGTRASDEQASQFLASTDRWFRPVQVRTGPDGALWVVDMYRYVIEHPRWIPPEVVAQLDTFAGQSRGRIYRIFPKGQPPRPAKRFDQLATAQLVAELDSPNGTQRDLVQQMLTWKNDRSVQQPLEQLAQHGKFPAGRLHALCTLDGLGELRDSVLLHALSDEHPEVRRHAIRLSEARLNESAELLDAVLALVSDVQPQVRLQLAHSLGECRAPRAADALARLATEAGRDAYLNAAVMSSANADNIHRILRGVLAASSAEGARGPVLQTLLGLAAKLGGRETMASVLETVITAQTKDSRWQLSALGTVLDALGRKQLKLEDLIDAPAQQRFERILGTARATAADNDARSQDRLAAITLIGKRPSRQGNALGLLTELLLPQNPAEIQNAAVGALGNLNSPAAASALLDALPSASPAVRGQMLDALLRRDTWVPTVLAAIESTKLLPSQIDAARRSRLLSHRDEKLRTRATKLFAATNADRKQMIAEYQAVLGTSGDVPRGKSVFGKVCASCHKLDDVGHAIGPDLAALSNRTPDALLVAILDPSGDVDARYQGYAAANVDGKVFSGLLADETSTSITIVEPENKRHTLLRNDIEELRATGKSMMPEGLEKDVTHAQMGDLLAYLASTTPKPKSFPGNKPETVVADAKGQLTLLATNGAIFGGDIVFEAPFQNVGYWHGENDRASWNVRVPESGRYDVYLDWACPPESAGSAFRVDGVQPVLRAKVASTGGWDRYRQTKLGSVSLAAGMQTITMRPDGPPRSAMLDLRGVYLVAQGETPAFAFAESKVAPPPTDPAEIAAVLLDEGRDKNERQTLIEENPDKAAAIVGAMVADLLPGSAQQYARIPWIWRVSVAAGKRNDTDQLKALLEVSLPTRGQPLSDWQAVVLGGGVVNGVSLSGVWPGPRVEELLEDNPDLTHRWKRALGQAAKIADNEKVKSGTRYDALRMIVLEGWQKRGAQLLKYLKHENVELQMGAVSALADLDVPQATSSLLESLPKLTERNRTLALEGLVRNEGRMTALLDAIESGSVKASVLGKEQVESLKTCSEEGIRKRAKTLLEGK